MKYHAVGDHHVLAFESGDDFPRPLEDYADEHRIGAAQVVAIGAFSSATIAYYDPSIKGYQEQKIDEQCEVLSLVGNISSFEGSPRMHLHVTMSQPDGSVIGGHLIRAVVRPTLEVILTALPMVLERSEDEGTGLPLLDL